ncbi:MAG TPA: hypothetical protein VKA49_02685 [Flavitalea sp.]|nr:hypothetical protein [Flavitalea sp.]
MKNKDVPGRESGKNEKINPETKKLGDKIGPANNRSKDSSSKESNKEAHTQENGENQDRKDGS